MIVVWAIAKKMLQEIIRKKAPVFLIALLVVLICFLPFLLRTDGTMKGRLRISLSYGLNISFVLLSLLTIVLGTKSFTGEIKHKQLYLVDSKPAARWKFFIGKFLGLCIFNFVALTIIGGAVWGSLHFQYLSLSTEKREQIQRDFFTFYRHKKAELDENVLLDKVDKIYEQKKYSLRDKSEREAKKSIYKELLSEFYTLKYHGDSKTWTFKDLPVSLQENPEQKLKLRYKINSSRNVSGSICTTKWQIGDGAPFDKTVYTGEYCEILIPVDAIRNGTLYITATHREASSGAISFPVHKGLEVYYPYGRFYENYYRGLFLIFIILSFLALVSLFTSTFLTFPVAILLGIYILFLGLLANFLIELVPEGTARLSKFQENIWFYFSQNGVRVLFVLLPNFGQYDPINSLASGYVVEWNLLAKAILILLFLRGGILTALGCLLFHFREIGKPMEN